MHRFARLFAGVRDVSLRRKALRVLFAFLVVGPLPAAADPPEITMSHRFLSYTATDAGVGGAEYEFTIKNDGARDLYDVRIALGIGAPLPVHHDGQPMLRLHALAGNEVVATTYTVTVREPDGLLADAVDLVGWVEAVEGHDGDIVNAGVVSRRERN